MMTKIALEKLEKLSCPSPGEALHVYHGRLCEGLHTENLTRQPPALTQVPLRASSQVGGSASVQLS